MLPTRGKMVVVYGMNNVGKSFFTEEIANYLRTKGLRIRQLKYPIYDLEPTGSKINDYLRHGNPEGITAQQAQEYFALNRQHFQPQLEGHLESGEWVVAEDYKGTGFCWGIISGVSFGRLIGMNQGLLDPDLSILLDGERVSSAIEPNHTHESLGNWNRGRQVHLEMAERFGWRVVENKLGDKEGVVREGILLLESEFPCLREGAHRLSKER
jgi:thymidylate kinase